MSGGFFRGTSADQDTRFSNKQAKLLKSQKFAPELEHLVDMTKVKMDVIRPWIATRATELLGFEDEVLINFVYGLLDGKAVDGKKIQIQLTGFMEKNTGKFMRELWSLLLSAQNNASGVPQQFLDAKEEEMRKKKAETDRIAQEIQKRKEREGKEPERGKQSRMDGEADILRSNNAVPNAVSKRSMPHASSVHSEEEREANDVHGRRAKNRHSKSPHSNDHSPSSHRNSPSAIKSSSKSFSKSRSCSEERPKSRSVSVSSQSQRHSLSPERRYRSPTRRSISPARRYRSPPRRSISPRRRYSPQNVSSPPRRSRRIPGSHQRHRSPSPSRRRSPHARRRSPFVRRRSPSPLRRTNIPSRHRSPARRRSPFSPRRRSPARHRSSSPARRRSPSPLRRRSPPPRSPKHRGRSPLHSPKNRIADSKISPRRRKRSHSPYKSQSPSYRARRSLSRERDSRTNGVESKRYHDDNASRRTERRSPIHHASDREVAERRERKVLDSVSHRFPISLRSPQRDSREQNDIRNRGPILSPEKFPNQSRSPTHYRETNPRKNRRSRSSSESPVKQSREQMPRYDNPKTSRDEQISPHREEVRHRSVSLRNKSKDLPADKGLKQFHASDFSSKVFSPDRSAENRSPFSRDHLVKLERKKGHEERRDMDLAERHVRRVSPTSEGVDHDPRRVREERLPMDDVHNKQQFTKQLARIASSSEEREYNVPAMKHAGVDGRRVNSEKQSHPRSDEYTEPHYEIESVTESKRKVDQSNLSDAIDSDTEETETYKSVEKRRHKKSDKHKKDVGDTSESDSEIDGRKDAKRRRKDEKRLRKEERRRRREERHRRKLERRASKLKTMPMDTVAVPPSVIEKKLNDSDESDGDAAIRKHSHPSDAEEPESEQKKLEIELRKKALESLRAKKAISD